MQKDVLAAWWQYRQIRAWRRPLGGFVSATAAQDIHKASPGFLQRAGLRVVYARRRSNRQAVVVGYIQDGSYDALLTVNEIVGQEDLVEVCLDVQADLD